MRPRRTTRVLLFVLMLVVLAPLAHASPPDPTWLSGFWDARDHDDVAILASSLLSTADDRPSDPLAPLPASSSKVLASEEGVPVPSRILVTAPRSPPPAQHI